MKGTWTAPDGDTEQDDVVMVEVVTDRFDRGWWRTCANKLATRFSQEVVHVRAMPVELLDEAGRADLRDRDRGVSGQESFA